MENLIFEKKFARVFVVIPVVQLPATHTWNIVWREQTINIVLAEGNNTVRIQWLPVPSCRQGLIQKTIRLIDTPAGIYLLQIIKGGQTETKKIVISH